MTIVIALWRLRPLMLSALAAVLAAAAGVAAGVAGAADLDPLVLPAERNPGRIRAWLYVPAQPRDPAPLVVALHGCAQSAHAYFHGGRWKSFADEHGFLVLLPEQPERMGARWVPERGELVPINNPGACFNFGEVYHATRGSGEARSIAELVKEVRSRHRTDTERTFVTGLSAGGGMTAVMLATYPDLFAGGAIIAGTPYRCATRTQTAHIRCGVRLPGLIGDYPAGDRTPAQWAEEVRKAGDAATRPLRLAIWRGLADRTVDPANGVELLEQWSEVLGIDLVPDLVDEDPVTHPHFIRRVYRDRDGGERIETFDVAGLDHALPVDGDGSFESCGPQGGSWPYVADADICSTARILRFWKIGRTGP